MVHTWISLCNNKIERPCENKRILRIFKNDDVCFYGDYELNIYLGTKHDYPNLETVVSKVISNSNGWVRYITPDNAKQTESSYLSNYISSCGWMPDNEFQKMWPRREDCRVVKGYELRKDGNFQMFACETSRFYYVICFATS